MKSKAYKKDVAGLTPFIAVMVHSCERSTQTIPVGDSRIIPASLASSRVTNYMVLHENRVHNFSTALALLRSIQRRKPPLVCCSIFIQPKMVSKCTNFLQLVIRWQFNTGWFDALQIVSPCPCKEAIDVLHNELYMCEHQRNLLHEQESSLWNKGFVAYTRDFKPWEKTLVEGNW